MERLTLNDLGKISYDPWELCGMDQHCTKGCHDDGGCTKGCHILKMYRKLARLEDLQEQGRLLELPCAVGDTIYEPTYDRMSEPQYFISESSVLDVSAKGILIAEDCFDEWGNLGKTVFLTHKEAEEALKRMEDGNEAD